MTPCHGLLLFLAMSTASAEAPEELLRLADQIGRIPDCVLEYKETSVDATGQNTHTHRFVKQGKCWREETSDADGSHRSMMTFDGEDYYVFHPKAEYLFVTRDPAPIQTYLQNLHLDSPLFSWAWPFFFRGRAQFKLPELGSREVWAAQLKKYTVTALERKPADGTRFALDDDEIQTEVRLEPREDGWTIIPETVRRDKVVTTPPGEMQAVTTRLTGWSRHPVGTAGAFVMLPSRREIEVRRMDGTVTAGGSTCEITLKTIAPVPADVDENYFRIPLVWVEKPIDWRNGRK
jgi:hypothetical protein